MNLKLQHFKRVWKGFNWWRKKYCFTRVLILFLVFSPILYERFSGSWIICDLVTIACDGIFISSIPQSEDALCKFYKFQEKRRLQLSIIDYADKNRNETLDSEEILLLRENGCDIDAILAPPMDLNLNKLAKNASLLGLLPPGYSTIEIREKAFFAAHAENEFIYKPQTDAVYDLINRQNWFFPEFTEKQKALYRLSYNKELPEVDYTTWNTWKNGCIELLGFLSWIFPSPLSTLTWIGMSVLSALFVVLSIKKYQRFSAIFITLLFLSASLYIRSSVDMKYSYLSPNSWYYFSYITLIFSLICLSLVASLTALKISKYIKNNKFWRLVVLFAIGITLFIRSLRIAPYHYFQLRNSLDNLMLPFSYFNHETIYNEFFFLSIIIMVVSIIMGYRYWMARKSSQPSDLSNCLP